MKAVFAPLSVLKILNAAVAQLTDEQKEQILQGAVASLTEEQKTQIKEAYIQQMMASDKVTSGINAAVATVSAAAKQVSELKGQLDNYGAFYVNKLYGGTKELVSGTSEFVGKTSNMDTQICDEIDSLTSSVTGNNDETVPFVSEKNTNVDSVQFVIKTATIEKTEAADSGAAEEVPLTFWQKLLRLFGLY